MSSRLFTFLILGLAIGLLGKMTFEYVRYRSWDRLEDEVDEWKQSPKGKFYGFLYGVDDTL